MGVSRLYLVITLFFDSSNLFLSFPTSFAANSLVVFDASEFFRHLKFSRWARKECRS